MIETKKLFEVRTSSGSIWWSRVKTFSTYEKAIAFVKRYGDPNHAPMQIRSLVMTLNNRWRECQVEWENQAAIDARNAHSGGR